jgi:DNA-binding response OmpR family regulator
MDARILVTESDWQLLDYAYRDLGTHGYEIVTARPEEAAVAHSRFHPDVVLTSMDDIERFEARSPGALSKMMAHSVVLVTVSLESETRDWQELARRGCEILFKPLLHVTELRAAMEFAVRNQRRAIYERRRNDEHDGGHFRAG